MFFSCLAASIELEQFCEVKFMFSDQTRERQKLELYVGKNCYLCIKI